MDYVKVNKVKDWINELEKNFSKDSQDKINEIVEQKIKKAVYRATENKRTKVLPRDF